VNVRGKALSLLLLLALGVSGCAQGGQAAPSPAPTAPPPAATPTPAPTPAPDPVQEILESMSREEKVGQLLVAGFSGLTPEGAKPAIRDCHVGGLILFGRNIEDAGQLLELTNGLKGENQGGIPLLVCLDQEGGRVDRMPAEVERTPAAYDIGALGDEGLVRRYGQLLAQACAAFGFNLDFAPVADIWSNSENTVIGTRAFGAEEERVSQCIAAAVEGVQSGGVLSVVKHFPGHGDTAMDSHLGLPVVERSLEELWSRELRPFQAAAGADGVMVGHIVLTALGEMPASLNPEIVDGLLREELGYSGVVFTDDMTMGAITQNYELGEACVLAVEAGCDMVLVCHGEEAVQTAYAALFEAVETGRIATERLDESVRRILTLKTEAGIKDLPVRSPDLEELNQAVRSIRAEAEK
jgi:beta-N-acetylhexosaminidase